MWPADEKTQELLQGAQEGNADAVNRLLDRHRDALRRMIQLRLDQRLSARLDVSDVVQDTLVEANRRLRDYLSNPAMPFHLWLRHIAQDRIIDAHRRHRDAARRSVDREQAPRAPGNIDHSTMDLAAQICDRELTPAARVTQQELAERMEATIAQLDEADREIVLMRHYEQLSNQEVAQTLGLSEPAASMRYLRAMRRLKEMLVDPNSSGGDA